MASKKPTVEFSVHFQYRDGVWRGLVHEDPYITAVGRTLAECRQQLDLGLRKAHMLVGQFRFRRRSTATSETWRGNPEVKQ